MNVSHSAWSLERSTASALDIADPLARYRSRFHLPITVDGNPQIYLCGHSLGLQPRNTTALLNEELLIWQTRAVEGHFTGQRPWQSYHELLAPGLAALTGALATEVVAMNSLSVNLHLLFISFYRPTAQRHKILIEAGAFPSDRYAIAAQLRMHGYDPATALLEITPRAGEALLRTQDILELLEREGASIATVLLPGVQYLTGQWLDLQAITRVAQQQGCSVGFDLAHAIGNVPLHLHDWNVDFAVWCSYKYLNAGPGAIGGAFVHERHAHTDLPRMAGWWGHDKATRFAMPESFVPLPGAEGWQLSNPPILACAPLLASLQIFEDAGIEAVRSKSMQLTGYLEYLLREQLSEHVALITPDDPNARGAQLSLRVLRERNTARRIHEQLMLQGMVCDWRDPDVIRVAPAPLYTRHVDVWQFVTALRGLLV